MHVLQLVEHRLRHLTAASQRLVERHEANFEPPWRMDLPKSYETSRLRSIVAFDIEISRVEGKFKLSQDRDHIDRRNVASRLDALGFDDAKAVAGLMRRRDDTTTEG